MTQKKNSQKAFDHWHRYNKEESKHYIYINALKLLVDFWIEVDKVQITLQREKT